MSGHWCFTHEKFMDPLSVERTCKPKGHDVDFENAFKPPNEPIRIKPAHQSDDRSLLHAQQVAKISEEMGQKTSLAYLERDNLFYYWNPEKKVWETDGLSYLMVLFNSIVPRVTPSKQKMFSDVLFQIKIDYVRRPKHFRPKPTVLYFKNTALDLEKLQITGKVPEDNIQIMLDTELSLNEKPPLLFLDALSKALPNPQELYDCLQALSSVLLIRTQRIEKAFFFLGSGGNGKCQKGTDVVLMADGSWKMIKDVQVGDEVVSPQLDGSSKIVKVITKHSRFENDVYDVVESTRRNRVLYTCAGNHDIPLIRTWSKRTSKDDSTPRITERRLFHYSAKRLSELANHKSEYVSFTTTECNFNNPTSKINPYLLGVYLGDGNSNTYVLKTFLQNGNHKKMNDLRLTSADEEIIKQLNIKWSSIKKHSKALSYRLSLTNGFADELKRVGLWGKGSGDKFIPKECLLSDRDYRIRLLDGMVDTDGFVDKIGCIWVTTKSLQLAEDIENLVFSLGGFASIRVIKKSIKSINFTGEYFEVSIQFEKIINSLIPRKQIRLKNKTNNPRHIAIECIKTVPQMIYGIEVDSPSKWYITNNWMVTHNTTIMKVLDNIFREYIAHVDMLDLQRDGFSKTALVDKLANSFSEISKMKQKDVGVFKAIASGDIQSVNSKFKERFDSVIKVIQFYSSNQMPEIEEVNEGFIRRAHPIEFNEKITKKDPYIDDKLNDAEERKKVLSLLIRIAKITKVHGFLFEKTFHEKENILLKKTNPVNEFLSAGIVLKREQYTIKKKRLHKLYSDYCRKNQYRPLNIIAFSRFMTGLGFQYGGRNEDPHWIGVGEPPISEGQKTI